MVNVYNEGTEIIARVNYNDKLDIWNGSNFQNGGTGNHLGVTQLKDKRMVLIYGSQWEGVANTARVVSDTEALQEILKAEKEELIDKFGLRTLYEKTILTEEIED